MRALLKGCGKTVALQRHISTLKDKLTNAVLIWSVESINYGWSINKSGNWEKRSNEFFFVI